MFRAIIDNLFILERLGDYIPTIIQIIIVIVWVILTRKSSRRYQMSLLISLFLLLIAISALVLTFETVAYIIGVYAFLFLGIGMVQSIFSD